MKPAPWTYFDDKVGPPIPANPSTVSLHENTNTNGTYLTLTLPSPQNAWADSERTWGDTAPDPATALPAVMQSAAQFASPAGLLLTPLPAARTTFPVAISSSPVCWTGACPSQIWMLFAVPMIGSGRGPSWQETLPGMPERRQRHRRCLQRWHLRLLLL
jgi:hypothetical protein